LHPKLADRDENRKPHSLFAMALAPEETMRNFQPQKGAKRGNIFKQQT